MTAFYPLPRCLFYRVGRFHCGRFIIVRMRTFLRSQLKKVVHRMSEILFAAQRAETVQYRQFAMIQIWKAKDSATVVRFDSVFAHDDSLPCRRIGTTTQTVGAMQAFGPDTGERILSAMPCLRQLRLRQ